MHMIHVETSSLDVTNCLKF